MTKKSKTTLVITVAIVALVFAVTAVLACVMLNEDNQTPVDTGMDTALQNKDALIAELSSLKTELYAQLASLTNEKKLLEERILELEVKLSDAGAAYSAEIEGLKADVIEKDAQIVKLRQDIDKFDNAFNVDVLEQARMIDEICSFIEDQAPYVKVITEKGDTDWRLIDELIEEERIKVADEGIELFTKEELEESGLNEAEFEKQKLRFRVMAREDVEKLRIGVYYEDILTGYSFGYNADEKFPYASVIKAPYVVSVLKQVSAEEQAYFDALREKGEEPSMIDTDGDGEPDTVKIEYTDSMYDLSEVVVYDSETMLRSGSGVIWNMPDGTEFTYLDFIRYAITDSDNVAYSQLRERFGYDCMYNSARSAGVSIANSSLSAKGAGKLFTTIWDFIEEDDTYGEFVYDALRRSNHRVVIPLALSTKIVLNKYGWDEGAYHDAGIVIAGERPYVLAVFTDLDFGGDTVNTYLREIVKKIDTLHSGFIGK